MFALRKERKGENDAARPRLRRLYKTNRYDATSSVTFTLRYYYFYTKTQTSWLPRVPKTNENEIHCNEQHHDEDSSIHQSSVFYSLALGMRANDDSGVKMSYAAGSYTSLANVGYMAHPVDDASVHM